MVYEKKGYNPWNKGLTKETDERIKSMSENISKSLKGKNIGYKFQKGMTLSEPHRKNISGAMKGNTNALGNRHSIESIEKMRLKKIGHLVSEETKEKIRNNQNNIKNRFQIGHKPLNLKLNNGSFKKGNVPWSKGLTKETDERVKKLAESKERREKISEFNKGNKNMLGKENKWGHHTKATKDILRQKSLGKISPRKGRSLEEEQGIEKAEYIKKKIKKARAKQIFPMKDTPIELKIQGFLTAIHVEYFTHKYISEITHSYQCDILIPKQETEGIIVPQKTIIECDGCYWHGCPVCNKKLNNYQNEQIKEDNIRTKELIEKGYKVIRLWEHNIKVMELNELKEKI